MERIILQDYALEKPEFILQQEKFRIRSQEDFNFGWNQIYQFLNSVLINQKDDLEEICFLEVKEEVDDICQNREDEKLNTNLQSYLKLVFEEKFKRFSKKDLDQQMQEENGEQSKLVLQSLNEIWNLLKEKLYFIEEILKTFESSYLFKRQIKTIRKMIMNQIRCVIDQAEFQNIKMTLNKYLQFEVQNFRQQNQFMDQELTKNLIQFCVDLDLYDSFEENLVQETQNYFEQLSIKLSKNFEILEYLKEIQKIIQLEEKFQNEYLEQQSFNKINKIIDEQLINFNKVKMYEQGLQSLLEKQDFQNLRIIFKMADRIKDLPYFANKYKEYIMQYGKKIFESDLSVDTVQQIIDLKKKLVLVEKNSFDSGRIIKDRRDDGFKYIFKLKPNNIAQFFSQYFDIKMKNKENVNVQQIDEELNQALDCYPYINATDIFMQFYNRRMLKRVILNQAFDDQLEISIIDKIKSIGGESKTEKTEALNKDIKNSQQLGEKFEKYLIKNSFNQVKPSFVKIMLIDSTNWPFKLNNNEHFEKIIFTQKPISNYFEKFLQEDENKKYKLFWQLECSSCDIEIYYKREENKKNQKIIFNVSLLQALVLLMFNQNKELDFKKIFQFLDLKDKEELKKVLLSLTQMKETQKLLNFQGDNKNIENGIFTLNDDYQSKKNYVKVNTIQKKETLEEIKIVQERVLFDRMLIIDSIIMRITKKKKQIKHNQLIDSVLETCTLPIEKNDIKKRVQNLLDKNFLRRDNDDQSVYHYINN